ncbi:hypothetical protein VUR80DRAFT_6582 [Thermomyces stellatus]
MAVRNWQSTPKGEGSSESAADLSVFSWDPKARHARTHRTGYVGFQFTQRMGHGWSGGKDRRGSGDEAAVSVAFRWPMLVLSLRQTGFDDSSRYTGWDISVCWCARFWRLSYARL